MASTAQTHSLTTPDQSALYSRPISLPLIAPAAERSASLAPCPGPRSLEIDGASQGERFVALIDGAPISLTGKSFKYLAKLACARLLSPEGWIYKDDIEWGFNQARYLYRLRKEVALAWPGNNWMVYENNRLGYYRLALEPGSIWVNAGNLADNPDHDVVQLAESIRQIMPQRRSA